MDEEERNAISHGVIEPTNCVMRFVVNGEKLAAECVVQFGDNDFTLNINKAIELGLLIKED